MMGDDRKLLAWGAAAIVAMTILAYWPASQNGEIWDDDYYVTENKQLHDAAGLARIWFELGAVPQYYPATYTSFWVEYQLFELDLRHYHWHNIFLHAVNAVLWFVLLRQLGLSNSAAWLAGAIFAVHPVFVETAAWISERKNLLSTFFYLLSALAYLRFGDERRRRWYVAALLLFVMALLSKTVTASLPAAILLVIYWRRGRLAWSDVKPLLPFFAAGIVMGLVTIYVEKTHIRAAGPDWDYTLLQRCLIAGRALVFYVGKLIWPANLTFIYPKWHIDPAQLRQYMYPLLAAATLVLLWFRRERMGRGPVVAALFFCGTLFPALGFINVFPMRYSFVADHFQYVASMGPITLATAVLARRRVGRIAMVALLPLLGYLTWQQTFIYRDMETLWRQTVTRNPTAWMAYNNLGVAVAERDDDIQAIKHYQDAIRYKPDHVAAYANMGESLVALGRDREAIGAYMQALKFNPRFAPAHAGAGHVFMKQNQLERAAHHFQQAVQSRKTMVEAWHNLGVVQLRLRRFDQAIDSLNRAAVLDPGNASTARALGEAYKRSGQYERAAASFQRAIALKPDSADAHHDMGLLLATVNRVDEAIVMLERAASLNPNSAVMHANLAVALQRAGRTDEAITSFTRSLQLEANRPATARNLAWVLATKADPAPGDGPRAIELAQTAMKLSGKRDAIHLDTLAAAMAQSGRFDEAAKWAQAARDQAVAENNPALANAIDTRAKLYEKRKPYRASGD